MLEKAKNFFTDLGWLSNSFTIVLGVITSVSLIYGLYKLVKSFYKNKSFKHSDFSSFVADKFQSWNQESLKNKKIAIIDDNPENYPLDYLNDSDFSVKTIKSISLTQVNSLIEYDLLILDITGIVQEDLVQGGLELLKRIKNKKPDALIIAASSKRFDPTLTEFFKLSNMQIKTPIEGPELEDILIKELNKKYCPNVIAKKLDENISGKSLTAKQKQNLIRYSNEFLENKITKEQFLQSNASLSHILDTHLIKNHLLTLKDIL